MALTKKMRDFCEEYVANGGNATRAYLKCYECEYTTANGQGYRLLRKPEVVETLNEHLIHCVAIGAKPTELKKLLQRDFGVSYSSADSLVRTEMAHIQTQASQKRYADYGITEVEVLADADERRCEVCGKLHQKRFPIHAQMPVPVHPRCRCTIIPVVENLTNKYEDDIIIGRSVGAMAKNYPVKAIDGR